MYASVAVARVKLDLDDLEGARADLDSCERILDDFGSVETVVHAAFYDTNATYYQVRSARCEGTVRKSRMANDDRVLLDEG